MLKPKTRVKVSGKFATVCEVPNRIIKKAEEGGIGLNGRVFILFDDEIDTSCMFYPYYLIHHSALTVVGNKECCNNPKIEKVYMIYSHFYICKNCGREVD